MPSGADPEHPAALVDRARQLWAGLAGVPVSFPRHGRSVVVAPGSQLCPPGWVGAIVIAGAALVTTPDAGTAAAVHRDLTGDPTDPAAWRRALPVGEVRGPATLADLHERDFAGADASAVEQGDATALLAATDPDEAEECGLAEITSPAYVIRAGDRVLAAAGYRVLAGAGGAPERADGRGRARPRAGTRGRRGGGRGRSRKRPAAAVAGPAGGVATRGARVGLPRARHAAQRAARREGRRRD